MRLSLEKEIERLESALSVWKWKYEELKESKAKSLKEVGRRVMERKQLTVFSVSMCNLVGRRLSRQEERRLKD